MAILGKASLPAIEIIMRRDNNPSIRCKINPVKQRPQHEQDELRSFSKEIEDLDELPACRHRGSSPSYGLR